MNLEEMILDVRVYRRADGVLLTRYGVNTRVVSELNVHLWAIQQTRYDSGYPYERDELEVVVANRSRMNRDDLREGKERFDFWLAIAVIVALIVLVLVLR